MSTIKVNALRHTGGSSDNINLDSSGQVLVGTSTAPSAQQIQAANTGGENLGTFRFSDNTGASDIAFHKSRGSLGNHSIVSDDDGIGSLVFRASDGSAYRNAASVSAFVDGTPGSSDMPGRLVFSTTADGASSPTEAVRIDSSQNLLFNSGFGSVGTAYGCRAWVNFNGTGTVAIRASGNISSITDINTGAYDPNFTTAMPDTNYCVVTDFGNNTSGGTCSGNIATGSFRMITMDGNFANTDRSIVFAAVFR